MSNTNTMYVRCNMSRFRELRKQAGYSQKKLGDMLFVNQTAVSQWETGKNFPNPTIQLKLCELYDVSLDYLWGITDIKKAPVPEDENEDPLFIRLSKFFRRLPEKDLEKYYRYLLALKEADEKGEL